MYYNNTMKKISAALSLIILLFAPSLSAQEIEEKTISGTASEIDWVGSIIAVRYCPAFSLDADEIGIKITHDTIMHRGTDSISLSDIEQEDPITVTYYDDGVSGLKARRLTDLNIANR